MRAWNSAGGSPCSASNRCIAGSSTLSTGLPSSTHSSSDVAERRHAVRGRAGRAARPPVRSATGDASPWSRRGRRRRGPPADRPRRGRRACEGCWWPDVLAQHRRQVHVVARPVHDDADRAVDCAGCAGRASRRSGRRPVGGCPRGGPPTGATRAAPEPAARTPAAIACSRGRRRAEQPRRRRRCTGSSSPPLRRAVPRRRREAGRLAASARDEAVVVGGVQSSSAEVHTRHGGRQHPETGTRRPIWAGSVATSPGRIGRPDTDAAQYSQRAIGAVSCGRCSRRSGRRTAGRRRRGVEATSAPPKIAATAPAVTERTSRSGPSTGSERRRVVGRPATQLVVGDLEPRDRWRTVDAQRVELEGVLADRHVARSPPPTSTATAAVDQELDVVPRRGRLRRRPSRRRCTATPPPTRASGLPPGPGIGPMPTSALVMPGISPPSSTLSTVAERSRRGDRHRRRLPPDRPA